MADVFLSYARQDTARATIIRDALQALGLSVFFDIEGLDGGDVFPDVLDREVKGAGAVVGVWSRHALTRPWVKVECDIGRARGVLVPVQIEEIPDLDRPAAFWNVQFDDLSDFDGDTEHAGWLRFIRALARTLDRPELLAREASGHGPTASQPDADVRAELDALKEELRVLQGFESAYLAGERPMPQQTQPAVQKDAPAAQPTDSSKLPGAKQAMPLPLAVLISAVAVNLVLYLINMLTTPMLVESMLNSEQTPAQIGMTLTVIGVVKGLIFTVIGALFARKLHYRRGIAWLAAAAIGAVSYLMTIGFALWRATELEGPADYLITTLASSLIFTIIVSALAGLIATLLPFFKPKPDLPGSFD